MEEKYWKLVQLAQTGLGMMIGFVGLVGNAAVTYIYTRKPSWSPTEKLIISISVVDILSCLYFLTFPLVKVFYDQFLPLQPCLADQFILWFIPLVSLFLMTAICFNRLTAVCFPIQYPQFFSVRNVRRLICGSVLYSASTGMTFAMLCFYYHATFKNWQYEESFWMMINKVATLHVMALYTLAIFGIVISSLISAASLKKRIRRKASLVASHFRETNDTSKDGERLKDVINSPADVRRGKSGSKVNVHGSDQTGHVRGSCQLSPCSAAVQHYQHKNSISKSPLHDDENRISRCDSDDLSSCSRSGITSAANQNHSSNGEEHSRRNSVVKQCNSGSGNAGGNGTGNANNRERDTPKDLKLTKALLVIALAYVVLCTPYILYHLLFRIYIDLTSFSKSKQFLMKTTVNLLYILNYTINPFTYYYLNEFFRTETNKILSSIVSSIRPRNESEAAIGRQSPDRIRRKSNVKTLLVAESEM